MEINEKNDPITAVENCLGPDSLSTYIIIIYYYAVPYPPQTIYSIHCLAFIGIPAIGRGGSWADLSFALDWMYHR